MTSQCNEGHIEVTSGAHTVGGSNGHGVQALSKKELDSDAYLVRWRITEWSDGGTRGLMMPYADPRGYSDRLNSLFAPAGWTRKYCFGLGPYLYDLDGQWIELEQEGGSKKIPKLPRWATRKEWLAGLQPKPRRNRHALVRARGHARNAGHTGSETIGHRQSRRPSKVTSSLNVPVELWDESRKGLNPTP